MSQGPQAEPGSPKRRRFTAEYKERILSALEGLDGRGAASALLRDEKLYWSHVAKWRRQREAGELEDSWTEPWVRSRIQTLIEERTELIRELESLEQRNLVLRGRLGLTQDSEPPKQAGARSSR